MAPSEFNDFILLGRFLKSVTDLAVIFRVYMKSRWCCGDVFSLRSMRIIALLVPHHGALSPNGMKGVKYLHMQLLCEFDTGFRMQIFESGKYKN